MLFCPQCGQQQPSDAVQFCTRCGLSLVGARDLIVRGGLGGAPTSELSPRQKGIRQGVMMMMSVALIAPVVVFLLVGMLGFPKHLIPLAAVLTVVGGFLRMLYAMFFEDNAMTHKMPYASAHAQFPPAAFAQNQNTLPHSATSPSRPALPFGNIPNNAPTPVGSWKRADTGELVQPPSVTENTTRLLEHPVAVEDAGERKQN